MCECRTPAVRTPQFDVISRPDNPILRKAFEPVKAVDDAISLVGDEVDGSARTDTELQPEPVDSDLTDRIGNVFAAPPAAPGPVKCTAGNDPPALAFGGGQLAVRIDHAAYGAAPDIDPDPLLGWG